MRLLEKLLFIYLAFGAIAKMILVFEGEYHFIGAYFLLSLFYFFLGFAFFNQIEFRAMFSKSSYTHTTFTKVFLGISLGITLFILMTGIALPMTAVAGGESMLEFSFYFGLLTLAVASLTYLKRKTEKIFFAIKRLLLFQIILTFLYLYPMDKRVRFLYREIPEYADAYVNFWNNPTDSNASLLNEAEKKYRVRN